MLTARANQFIAERKLPAIFLAGLLSLLLVTPSLPADRSQDKKTRGDDSQPSADDTVKLHSDLVVVNLIVTDATGQYAHGLGVKDFSVVEDGAAQTVNDLISEEASFAAAILIDMSGSMDYKFGLVRAPLLPS